MQNKTWYLNISAYNLRPYQQEAIKKWIENGFCGFFEMATGTGKTVTALFCAQYLANLESRISLLILVPTLDLAVQWREDVKKIITRNIILANSKNPRWYDEALTALQVQWENDFCIIATYATFLTGKFQYIVSKLSSETILLADEVHNFGTTLYISLYPKHFKRRIGLSATPVRHFDEDGTKAIMDYFNTSTSPTFRFTMRQAIHEGYLCEYYYYPLIVSLTDKELADYKAISKKLAKYFIAGEDFNDNPIVTALLLKRKKIIHNASEKINVLRDIFKELLSQKKDLKYILVYVPEGNEKSEEAINKKLINEYSKVIALEFGLTQHQFIGLTKDRSSILAQFDRGKISVLTAMKCLDEGVDIPRAEMAIFCSSTGNPRQFIQRRGRILRPHPDKKNAVIYDMIVVPGISDLDFNSSISMERSMLQSELRRVHEFAGLALNQYQALRSLETVALEYDLDIYSKM